MIPASVVLKRSTASSQNVSTRIRECPVYNLPCLGFGGGLPYHSSARYAARCPGSHRSRTLLLTIGLVVGVIVFTTLLFSVALLNSVIGLRAEQSATAARIAAAGAERGQTVLALLWKPPARRRRTAVRLERASETSYRRSPPRSTPCVPAARSRSRRQSHPGHSARGRRSSFAGRCGDERLAADRCRYRRCERRPAPRSRARRRGRTARGRRLSRLRAPGTRDHRRRTDAEQRGGDAPQHPHGFRHLHLSLYRLEFARSRASKSGTSRRCCRRPSPPQRGSQAAHATSRKRRPTPTRSWTP